MLYILALRPALRLVHGQKRTWLCAPAWTELQAPPLLGLRGHPCTEHGADSLTHPDTSQPLPRGFLQATTSNFQDAAGEISQEKKNNKTEKKQAVRQATISLPLLQNSDRDIAKRSPFWLSHTPQALKPLLTQPPQLISVPGAISLQ